MKLCSIKTLDGYRLNGFLDKSHSKKKVEDRLVVIYTHGITSNCLEYKNRVIAKYLNRNGIDFLSFNNRGCELVSKLRPENPETPEKIAGSSFENIYECENDIIGAINKALELGYKKIVLLGHSLSCTKIMYTYKKMQQANSAFLKYIKGIAFLSMVDIPTIANIYIKSTYTNILEVAKKKEQEGKIFETIPLDNLIIPVGIKTFLNFADDTKNKELDFLNIHHGDHLKDINNIEVPLFMRWGDTRELIEYPTNRYVKIIDKKIKKQDKDIDYIEGANHSYAGVENELAKQFVRYIKKFNLN